MLRRTIGFDTDGYVRPLQNPGLGIEIDAEVPREMHFEMQASP